MVTEFILLIVGGYLMGSVPATYLAARWSRRVDLRKHGSGNVGGANLFKVTSKRIAIPASIFDFGKAMPAIAVAHVIGLDITQQVIIGLAAVVGHNWPVFLRFSGGRGIATTMGVTFIVPVLNGMVPWSLISFLAAIEDGY